MMVCTLRWLEQNRPEDMFFGADYLIVAKYELAAIETLLQRYCEGFSGENWLEIGAKIGRVAHWEFEDYQP